MISTCGSFTTFPGKKWFWFWPMKVSRNSPRKNDFDLWWFRVILQGKMFLIRPRNSPFLRGRIGKSANNHEAFWRTLPVKMVKIVRRKNTFKCVGVDFSSRFIHQSLSLNFIFCDYLCEGWERELLKFSAPFGFWEGRVFWILSVLGRGRNFNTGSGSRA